MHIPRLGRTDSVKRFEGNTFSTIDFLDNPITHRGTTMSTFAKNMKRIAALSLAGLAICAMIAAPAAAATYNWVGTTGALPPSSMAWSDVNNWAPNTAYTSADDIVFTNTAAGSGAVTNEVTASTAVNSLWYQQSDTAYIQTTQIDANQTLKVQGFNATTPSGFSDKFSLYAGNLGTTQTSVLKTVITGTGGTLDVSNATGGNTGGDIQVAMMSGNAGTTYPDHTAILDMSGLTTFNANVDQMLIGVTAATNATYDRPNGIVYLAQNNTITLNNALSYANPTGNPPLLTLPGGGLVIGYGSNRGAGDTYINALYLGQTNTIYVSNVLVGGRFRSGLMAFISKTNGSTLKMRGVGSTDANPVRVSSITLGDNTNNSTGGNSTVGTIDLRGGNADIMATSIVLGQSSTNYVGVNTRNGFKETGNLHFDTGTIDTTGMIVANEATNLNSTTVGSVNVSGTATLTIGANGLTMSNYNAGTSGAYYGACAPSTSTLNVSGGTVTVAGGINTDVLNGGAGPNSGVIVASTINVTGGSVTLGGDITKGVATANTSGTVSTTVKIDGGTLDMGSHAFGSATAPLTTLNLYSGTLKNVSDVHVGASNALVKNWDGTTAGTLILDGTNTYTGITQVTGGTLKLAATCTIASSTIDVAAGILDVTAFGTGYTVGSGKTIQGNGTVNGSINVAGTLATGESAPGILTVNGNANLSGVDAVDINTATAGTGYDQLVVNGSTNTVALAGTLALTVSPTFIPNSDVFWIVLNNDSLGSAGLTGTFSSTTGLPAGWNVLYNVEYDTSNLTPGSGNDVAIVAVPEPATLAMLIIAAGLCLVFKRFRNN
jgi:hypothetical protein